MPTPINALVLMNQLIWIAVGSGLLAWTCKKFCYASLQNRGGGTEPTPKGSQEGEDLIAPHALRDAIGEGRAKAALARLMKEYAYPASRPDPQEWPAAHGVSAGPGSGLRFPV